MTKGAARHAIVKGSEEVTTDLDAEEHRLCSETIRRLQGERQEARAERDRLAAELAEAKDRHAEEIAETNLGANRALDDLRDRLAEANNSRDYYARDSDLREEARAALEAQLALDAPIAAAARAYQVAVDSFTQTYVWAKGVSDVERALLDLCRAQVKK